MNLKKNDYVVVLVIPGHLVRGTIKHIHEPFGGLIIEDDSGNIHHIRTWTMAQLSKPDSKLEVVN